MSQLNYVINKALCEREEEESFIGV